MKIISKAFFLLLVVMMMFFFVACDSSPKTEEMKSDVVAVDEEKEIAEVTEEHEADAENDKQETNGGVNLPEGYPVDLVPIMDDATSGSGIGTDGVFNITYSTPSTEEQVMEFYTQHFQKYGDAVIIADNNLEINLTAEGRDIQILIDPSGQATSLRIFIGGASQQSADLNNDFDNNETASNSGVSKEFPTEIVPIMDGAKVFDMSSQEEEYGTEYSVNFSTNKPFKDVAGFYKDIVNAMDKANITDGDYEFFATAIKGENSVEIQIMDTGDSQTIVLINIYPK